MLLVCLALFLLPLLVNAQSNRLFQWGFGGSLSTSLPACQDVQIVVKSFNADNSTKGVPPYYMHAYAPGKLPETQFIGNDEANLKWTVNFPAETELMLNVVDSNSSSGGVPPRLFTVVENPSSTAQCGSETLKNPPSDFTISANLTDAETCEPWGISVKGGIKPYTITFLALNSPVTTNASFGPVDDAFTFINRAEPNSKLVAAVSDVTGRWASGTALVNTHGSTDATCEGLVSTSGSAALLAKDAADRAKAAKKKQQMLLAGVLTPILVLLLAAAVGGWFWYRKRKRNGQPAGVFSFVNGNKGVRRLGSTDNMSVNTGAGNSVMPDVESGHSMRQQDGTVLSINSYLDGPTTAATHTTQHTQHALGTTISPTYSTMYTGSPTQMTSRSDTMSSRGSRPGFTSFPARSIRSSTGRGSAKAIEAGFSLDDVDESGPSGSRAAIPSSIFSPDSPRLAEPEPSSQRRQLPTPQPRPGQEEMVFQHTDSGIPGVRELPPPYIDRGEGSGDNAR